MAAWLAPVHGAPTPATDIRLDRKVTAAFKAMALSDVCDRLRADTRVALTAGPSVADEKVTLFCENLPLREVMRQLSRPFGYTWLRSGTEKEYRYELVQDLRSQLEEEALRRRDRNEALLALDREMGRYRAYLGLSPEQAERRAASASPDEKKLLEQLAWPGWGALQLYSRLSPDEMAALRSGQTLTFSSAPERGQRPLPPELARGVLQSVRVWRVVKTGEELRLGTEKTLAEGQPPASLPDARAVVSLRLGQSELGSLTLSVGGGFTLGTPGELLAALEESDPRFHGAVVSGDPGGGAINFLPLAAGVSPMATRPNNAAANAMLARDASLQPRVTIHPRSACGGDAAIPPASTPRRPPNTPALPSPGPPEPKATSADVLEALHHATGLPIVADYYTRLYRPAEVSVEKRTLFDALNQLADTMRLRCRKDGAWLQFRSASFYDDRLKEVPNRLLTLWSASRLQNGALTIDDLIEIAQLSDAQLDAKQMAEGARLCFGLAEWNLVEPRGLRPHLRYLAGLSAAQRQQAQEVGGLLFTQMSLSQQQAFLALALGRQGEQVVLESADLPPATLRVEYTVPGWFQWTPLKPSAGSPASAAPLMVRERTREAAFQTARRWDPQVTDAQITPTELNPKFTYTLGRSDERRIRRTVTPTGGGFHSPSGQRQ